MHREGDLVIACLARSCRLQHFDGAKAGGRWIPQRNVQPMPELVLIAGRKGSKLEHQNKGTGRVILSGPVLPLAATTALELHRRAFDTAE